MSVITGRRIAEELLLLPNYVRQILRQHEAVKKIANKYYKYPSCLFLGRKYNFPIALEGALKLKEISYIHAEGYGAGEMKHGLIALIDKDFPTIVLIPEDSVYDKVIANIDIPKTIDLINRLRPIRCPNFKTLE